MNRTLAAPASMLPAPPPAASRRWLRALVATCLAVVAGLATVAITNEGTLLAFDTAVQERVIDARIGWLNQAMIWLTFLGTRYAIGAAAFGLVLWSALTGQARLLVGVIVGALVGMLAAEWWQRDSLSSAWSSTLATAKGFGASALAQFAIGWVMLVAWSFWAASLVVF